MEGNGKVLDLQSRGLVPRELNSWKEGRKED